jgi:3-oxoacyl-[acyl-carrier protein] reductase
MTPELFDSIMQVNVRAPYFLCQRALPELKASSCATIINICSVVAHKGYPRQSVYAASKHALLGWSKSFANEFYKDDIRVHVISPGSVFTKMIAMVRPDLTPEGMMLPEDIADIIGVYLQFRKTNAVIDEIEAHRVTKEPFA